MLGWWLSRTEWWKVNRVSRGYRPWWTGSFGHFRMLWVKAPSATWFSLWVPDLKEFRANELGAILFIMQSIRILKCVCSVVTVFLSTQVIMCPDRVILCIFLLSNKAVHPSICLSVSLINDIQQKDLLSGLTNIIQKQENTLIFLDSPSLSHFFPYSYSFPLDPILIQFLQCNKSLIHNTEKMTLCFIYLYYLSTGM